MKYLFGERGEFPVRFETDRNTAASLAYSIPGVSRDRNTICCTWDAANIVAPLVGYPIPEPPIVDITTLQGLQAYRDLKLHERLRSYQKEAAAFLAVRAYAFCCDEMRLGKTPTSIAAALLNGAKRILIIPPGSLRLQWAEEIANWTGDKALILYGRAANKARWYGDRRYLYSENAILALRAAKWVICNADLMLAQSATDGAGKAYIREDFPGWGNVLAGQHFDLAIIDEIHKFRGWKQSRKLDENIREIVARVIDPIRAVWGLTGTPFSGYARDFYTPWQLVSKCVGTKPFTYQARYAAAKHVDVQIDTHTVIRAWNDKGRSNEDELRTRMKWIMIQRFQKDVLDQLPEVTRTIHRVEGEAANLPTRGDATSKVARLLKSTLSEKLPALAELAEAEFAENRKIIVFTYLRESAKVATEALAKLAKKNPALRIFNGEAAGDRRAELARSFREHVGAAAFVSTVDSAEVGLNLVGAKTTYFVELHHSPASCRQAEMRNRLPGVRGVSIVYLIVPESIDEIRAMDIVPKLETMEQLAGDPDSPEMRQALESLNVVLSPQQQIDRLTSWIDEDTEIDDED